MVKNLLEAEWLTAEFQVVLDQIFARFDADDDGLWSINEELQSFAMYGIEPPTGHFTSSCEGTSTRLITASRVGSSCLLYMLMCDISMPLNAS